MMARKKKRRSYKSGIYIPTNKRKCLQPSCEYRSSWELQFMEWCDSNPYIVKWGSEKLAIPYMSPVTNTVRRYFPDMLVYKRVNDKIEKYIVEIKPSAQTRPPKPSARKKQSTMLYESKQWVTNQAKWQAAQKFAGKHGWRFIILTENSLSI